MGSRHDHKQPSGSLPLALGALVSADSAECHDVSTELANPDISIEISSPADEGDAGMTTGTTVCTGSTL